MAGTVFVGCKIPSGLMLQLRNEQGEVVQQQALLGSQLPHLSAEVPSPNVLRENGVGLTRVDKDLWDAWEDWAMKNRFEPYMQGFVFANVKMEGAMAEAREKIQERTLLEGLDPANTSDPRVAEFKAIEKAVV